MRPFSGVRRLLLSMTTAEAPTFTGDELDWKPVDDGKNSDAINVHEGAKELVVEVVKEEDVDFGNDEEDANFEGSKLLKMRPLSTT